jgi:DNA-binding NarL/FixJ family response regulator
MPIKVSIVEDDADTRGSLVALLEGEADFRCPGAYRSGEQAVRAIPLDPPDVALVDINLPGMNGIECVSQLAVMVPKLQMLMITNYEESDLIFESLRQGASGYLLKKTLDTELIPSIRQTLAGGAPMSMLIARKVVDHFHRIERPASDVDRLSPREQAILKLLSQGLYYKEIGDHLGLSMNTVKTHLHEIYGKLHVRSRTQATLKYLAGKK